MGCGTSKSAHEATSDLWEIVNKSVDRFTSASEVESLLQSGADILAEQPTPPGFGTRYMYTETKYQEKTHRTYGRIPEADNCSRVAKLLATRATMLIREEVETGNLDRVKLLNEKLGADLSGTLEIAIRGSECHIDLVTYIIEQVPSERLAIGAAVLKATPPQAMHTVAKDKIVQLYLQAKLSEILVELPNTVSAVDAPAGSEANKKLITSAQLLIDNGASLSKVDDRTGNTVLHNAISQNHTSLIRVLLKAGADSSYINKKTNRDMISLAQSAIPVNPDIIELLKSQAYNIGLHKKVIELGQDFASKFIRNESVDYARWSSEFTTLIQKGAEIDSCNEQRQTALHLLLVVMGKYAPASAAIGFVESSNPSTPPPTSPGAPTSPVATSTAALSSSTPPHITYSQFFTLFLVNFNADPELYDLNNKRPIEIAIDMNVDVSVMRLLLNVSAMRNKKTGESILIEAKRACGFPVDQPLPRSSSAAASAITPTYTLIQSFLNQMLWNICLTSRADGKYNSEIKQLIKETIELGANINTRSGDQEHDAYTPLCLLAKRGNVDLMEYCIGEFLANPLIVAKSSGAQRNNTPLHIAASNGRLEILQYLRSFHFDLNVMNRRRESPLHLAARGGHVQCVMYLVRQGCATTILNTNDCTPEDVARHAAATSSGSESNSSSSNGGSNKFAPISHTLVVSFLSRCNIVNYPDLRSEASIPIVSAGKVDLATIDLCEKCTWIEPELTKPAGKEDELLSGEKSLGLLKGTVNNQLRTAAKKGSIEEVKQALADGADIRSVDSDNLCSFALASIQREIEYQEKSSAESYDTKRDRGERADACSIIASFLSELASEQLKKAIMEGNTPRMVAYHYCGGTIKDLVHLCVSEGKDNVDMIHYLVSKHDIEKKYDSTISPEKPDIDNLPLLWSEFPLPASKNAPYHIAVSRGNKKVAGYIRTRLSMELANAITEKDYAHVTELIDAGAVPDMVSANPTAANDDSQDNITRVLAWRCDTENTQAAQHRMIVLLLDNGARIPAKRFPSVQAIDLDRDLTAGVRYLLHQRFLNRALRTACASGQLDEVKKYHQQGADLSARGCYGMTPLMMSLTYTHAANVVHYLVARGGSVLTKADEEEAAATVAANAPAAIPTSPASASSPSAASSSSSSSSSTPRPTIFTLSSTKEHGGVKNPILLYLKSSLPYSLLFSLILDSSVEEALTPFQALYTLAGGIGAHDLKAMRDLVRFSDDQQNTLIHYTAVWSNVTILRWLFDHKALLHTLNKYNEYPLTLAIERGNSELVEFLIKHDNDAGKMKIGDGSVTAQEAVRKVQKQKQAEQDAVQVPMITPVHIASLKPLEIRSPGVSVAPSRAPSPPPHASNSSPQPMQQQQQEEKSEPIVVVEKPTARPLPPIPMRVSVTERPPEAVPAPTAEPAPMMTLAVSPNPVVRGSVHFNNKRTNVFGEEIEDDQEELRVDRGAQQGVGDDDEEEVDGGDHGFGVEDDHPFATASATPAETSRTTKPQQHEQKMVDVQQQQQQQQSQQQQRDSMEHIMRQQILATAAQTRVSHAAEVESVQPSPQPSAQQSAQPSPQPSAKPSPQASLSSTPRESPRSSLLINNNNNNNNATGTSKIESSQPSPTATPPPGQQKVQKKKKEKGMAGFMSALSVLSNPAPAPQQQSPPQARKIQPTTQQSGGASSSSPQQQQQQQASVMSSVASAAPSVAPSATPSASSTPPPHQRRHHKQHSSVSQSTSPDTNSFSYYLSTLFMLLTGIDQQIDLDDPSTSEKFMRNMLMQIKQQHEILLYHTSTSSLLQELGVKQIGEYNNHLKYYVGILKKMNQSRVALEQEVMKFQQELKEVEEELKTVVDTSSASASTLLQDQHDLTSDLRDASSELLGLTELIKLYEKSQQVTMKKQKMLEVYTSLSSAGGENGSSSSTGATPTNSNSLFIFYLFQNYLHQLFIVCKLAMTRLGNGAISSIGAGGATPEGGQSDILPIMNLLNQVASAASSTSMFTTLPTISLLLSNSHQLSLRPLIRAYSTQSHSQSRADLANLTVLANVIGAEQAAMETTTALITYYVQIIKAIGESAPTTAASAVPTTPLTPTPLLTEPHYSSASLTHLSSYFLLLVLDALSADNPREAESLGQLLWMAIVASDTLSTASSAAASATSLFSASFGQEHVSLLDKSSRVQSIPLQILLGSVALLDTQNQLYVPDMKIWKAMPSSDSLPFFTISQLTLLISESDSQYILSHRHLRPVVKGMAVLMKSTFVKIGSVKELEKVEEKMKLGEEVRMMTEEEEEEEGKRKQQEQQQQLQAAAARKVESKVASPVGSARNSRRTTATGAILSPTSTTATPARVASPPVVVSPVAAKAAVPTSSPSAAAATAAPPAAAAVAVTSPVVAASSSPVATTPAPAASSPPAATVAAVAPPPVPSEAQLSKVRDEMHSKHIAYQTSLEQSLSTMKQESVALQAAFKTQLQAQQSDFIRIFQQQQAVYEQRMEEMEQKLNQVMTQQQQQPTITKSPPQQQRQQNRQRPT